MHIKENLYGCNNVENEFSFEEVIKENEKKILNLIFGMTGDYHLSEDLTQETFVKAFNAISNFNGKSKISTWLYRIAVNVTIDYQKKLATHKESPSELNDCETINHTNSEETDNQCQKHAIRDILFSTISKMPEQQKEVFILREINGCSTKEVAEILDCSLDLVKWRLHKARSYLRKEFSKDIKYKEVGTFKLDSFGLK